MTKDGLFPGIQYPRVPGHEVIGVIDAVGPNVPRWKPGQRVGVGWNGGYCGYCDNCRRGDFFTCQTSTEVTGITRDGGYAEYMLAPISALALVPERTFVHRRGAAHVRGRHHVQLSSQQRRAPRAIWSRWSASAASAIWPCNTRRRWAAKPSPSHAEKTKSRSPVKLGAHYHIDNKTQDPAAELQKLGGAKVILATVTSADAMKAVLGGLGVRGKLMVIGAVPSLEVNTLQMICLRSIRHGWYSGMSIDSEDTLNFSALSGVQSMNEVFPLDRAAEAYDHMLSGKARFRVVLEGIAGRTGSKARN